MCQGRADGAEDTFVADVDSMLSKEGRARQMAGLRKVVTAFAGVPGIIGLHGGLPPATAFPIKGVTLTLENGHKVEIGDPVKVRIRSDTRHARLLSKHTEQADVRNGPYISLIRIAAHILLVSMQVACREVEWEPCHVRRMWCKPFDTA